MSRFGWSKYRRATGVWASAPKERHRVPLPGFGEATGHTAQLWAVVGSCKYAIWPGSLCFQNSHSSLLHLLHRAAQHPILSSPGCTSPRDRLT